MIKIMLAERLAERGLTQADLARATGIRAATINDLYHNRARQISIKNLNAICEALLCDLPDLLTQHYDLVKQREAQARRKIADAPAVQTKGTR